MFSRDIALEASEFLSNQKKDDYQAGEYSHKITGNRIKVKSISGAYMVIDVHGSEVARRKDELDQYNFISKKILH